MGHRWRVLMDDEHPEHMRKLRESMDCIVEMSFWERLQSFHLFAVETWFHSSSIAHEMDSNYFNHGHLGVPRPTTPHLVCLPV